MWGIPEGVTADGTSLLSSETTKNNSQRLLTLDEKMTAVCISQIQVSEKSTKIGNNNNKTKEKKKKGTVLVQTVGMAESRYSNTKHKRQTQVRKNQALALSKGIFSSASHCCLCLQSRCARIATEARGPC